MMRSLLFILAWMGCSLGLYGYLALIDIYWNTINWTPRYDLVFLFWFGGLVGALTGIYFLTLRHGGGMVKAFSFLLCSVLIALGIYLVAAEPVQTEGLLARVASSPLWYRSARLLILALPMFFWVLSASSRGCVWERLAANSQANS